MNRKIVPPTLFQAGLLQVNIQQSREIAGSKRASTMRKFAPATDGLTPGASEMDALPATTPRSISQAVPEATGGALAEEVSVISSIPGAVAPKHSIEFFN